MYTTAMVDRAEYCYGHPLAQRFINWVNHSTTAVITQPWQTIGAKYVTAGHVYDGRLTLVNPQFTKEPDRVIREVADYMLNPDTETFLWSLEMLSMAMGVTLPEHTVSSEGLPFKQMLFIYDRPYPLGLVGCSNGTRYFSTWTELTDIGTGISIIHDAIREEVVDGKHEQPLGDIDTLWIPYGRVYPHGYAPDKVESIKFMLTLIAFLSSPYVSKDKQRSSRLERKEVARSPQYRETADDTVNVVVLRREVKERIERMREEGIGSGRRHHSVSGHYKQQPYGPGRTERKMIWIPPYERGDKLLGMVEKVYHVKR